ncbi:MAG: hypothetical protein OXI36_00440 [Gammaproteobacteria bacterium]|nr:hypothetical protein [Gammaproteobacteria bacterium]MDE0401885.1 hypothetical protein [Gammaproteobacteria bacterium]
MKLLQTTFRTIVLVGVFFLGYLVLPGCVSITQQQFREADTGIEEGEVIAILRRKSNTRNETEESFIECLTEKTSSGQGAIEVMSDREFVDALFPWFEPRSAPRNVDEMPRYFENENIRETLEQIDARYIVWVNGTTQRTDQSGSVQCAVATGGIPACFGFLTWEAGSDYEATIWDIDRGITVGRLSAESKGMSFVPAIVVPIPFVARTQASACASLAEQLKDFIAGKDPVEE